MIKYSLTIILALIIITSVDAQQHKCSHHPSFQKSQLSDTLDAIGYTIYITEIDFSEQTIEAQCDVLLSAKVDGVAEVKLELRDLDVNEVKINGVSVANFTYEDQLISIPLSDPINTNDLVTATILYGGEPFHESWGGFHWSGEYCFNLGVGFESIPHNLGKTWFPCIDDFQDRATYNLYVTADEAKDVVCGGLLQSVTNNGNGTKTWHWHLEQTIPTYLASVAVGDYAQWTDTYSGIEAEIPIEIWVKPGDSADVDGSFQNLNAILNIFEQSFGPYRWDRVGYVGTAIGAMEHATNIAYPHFAINGGLGYESLLAHELSHMWFGDNVTCASAEEMWLNEGWAVFSDALYQEGLYGEEQYRNFINDMHANVLQVCHTSGGDGSYFPINDIPQEYTYGLSAYDRGSTIAYTLRDYLDDELFFPAMAAYNETFKFNYADSYDLRDLLTTETGIDMGPWFDNWVFNSGTPNYTIDSFQVVPNANGAEVTVFMKQKRHGPAFMGNGNKVELSFFDVGLQQHDAYITFDGETGSMAFQVPFQPDFVITDFNEKQCDATTDGFNEIAETGNYDFGDTFFDLEVGDVPSTGWLWVGHQWAPPDALQTPVQGLTISDYRYWRIEGVIPADMEATGVFWYNRNAFLDDGIILSDADSVVIMFRHNRNHDWQFVDFTKIGLWNIGKLYVENLQTGEYTIAVCDDTFVGLQENKIKTGFHVFPNPSNEGFNIELPEAGTMKFYTLTGKLIESHFISQKGSWYWEPEAMHDGIYLLHFINNSNQTLAVERLVFNR